MVESVEAACTFYINTKINFYDQAISIHDKDFLHMLLMGH
jgi:hypothetical protein